MFNKNIYSYSVEDEKMLKSLPILKKRAESFNINLALENINKNIKDKEVKTSSLIKYIQKVDNLSFVEARDFLNILISSRKAKVSSFTSITFL